MAFQVWWGSSDWIAGDSHHAPNNGDGDALLSDKILSTSRAWSNSEFSSPGRFTAATSLLSFAMAPETLTSAGVVVCASVILFIDSMVSFRSPERQVSRAGPL